MVELLLVFVSNFRSEMNFMSLKKVVFFLVWGVFTVNVMRKQTNKQKDPQVLLFLFLSLPLDICFTLTKGDRY